MQIEKEQALDFMLKYLDERGASELDEFKLEMAKHINNLDIKKLIEILHSAQYIGFYSQPAVNKMVNSIFITEAGKTFYHKGGYGREKEMYKLAHSSHGLTKENTKYVKATFYVTVFIAIITVITLIKTCH